VASRPNRRILGIGELGRRLIAAFASVALATVVAEIVIASVSASTDVNQLVRTQETQLTRAAAATAGVAYMGGSNFSGIRLDTLAALASQFDSAVQVRSATGRIVASSPGFAGFRHLREFAAPILVHGSRVGSVLLRFGPRGLEMAANTLQAERWRARIYAAAAGVLVALLVSVIMARRITSPLERMLATMRARIAGDRAARVTDVRAVGVLRELLEDFNRAANAFDQQDQAQRNLVANVAHELRTPVAVLQAGHEAMLDGVTEPTPQNLSSLRDEVLRLTRVLEDLQTLAADEAAAIQLRLVRQDFAAIAGAAADSLSAAFEMAGVSLRTDLTPVCIMCDYDRIREVVANLLTNALKYTSSGGVVTVETWPSEPRRALVRVTDTGIGIPPDELPHVTERFFRGRRAAEYAAGSGFGLTIVSELVRAHAGSITIASEPGRGTEVTVILPRAAAA
jgi:two-component system sensor histidine kinase BaeS